MLHGIVPSKKKRIILNEHIICNLFSSDCLELKIFKTVFPIKSAAEL